MLMVRVSHELSEVFTQTRGNYDLFPLDNPDRMELYNRLANISIRNGFAYDYWGPDENPRVLDSSVVESLISEALQPF